MQHLFSCAAQAFEAAGQLIEAKDAADSWQSDEEVKAAILSRLDLERAVASAHSENLCDVATKLRHALTILRETGDGGEVENRIRRMVDGALIDVERFARYPGRSIS